MEELENSQWTLNQIFDFDSMFTGNSPIPLYFILLSQCSFDYIFHVSSLCYFSSLFSYFSSLFSYFSSLFSYFSSLFSYFSSLFSYFSSLFSYITAFFVLFIYFYFPCWPCVVLKRIYIQTHRVLAVAVFVFCARFESVCQLYRFECFVRVLKVYVNCRLE